MFILGIPWIFNIIAGIGANSNWNETTVKIFQWLSIGFNCSYGFFTFLYLVVCNRKVQTASKRIMRTSTLATKSTKVRSKSSNQNVFQRNRGNTTKSGEIPIINGNGSSGSGTPSSTSSKMRKRW